MIVITSFDGIPRRCDPGDLFRLTVTQPNGTEVVSEEEITVSKVIDFICSFRFTQEDGSCIGFHLSGFFGCKDELPKEILEAKQLKDLTTIQRDNFLRTCGIKIS